MTRPPPETGRPYFGDAIELLSRLPEACAQAIIADPPYFNVLPKEEWDSQWPTPEAYLDWSLAWVTPAMRALRPDGLMFLFGQPGKREHIFLHLMSRLCERHRFHDLFIWDRIVGYNERRDSLTPSYEMILVLGGPEPAKFRKDRVRIPYDQKTIRTYLRDPRYKNKQARVRHLEAGKYATNILRVPSLKGTSKEKCGHPSQKPLDLIEKLILMSTDEGDLVLDPFLGSGTTAIAATRHNRRWIGFESNPAYIEITRRRLAKDAPFFQRANCATPLRNA